MLICRFYILVGPSESWKLIGVRGYLLNMSVRMKQILRMRPIQVISYDWLESFSVSRLQIQMRSLQSLVLLIVVHLVINSPLLIVASLVDRLLGKSRFN